jgi:hypothetical protein
LKTGEFQPVEVRQVMIPKASGKQTGRRLLSFRNRTSAKPDVLPGGAGHH